MPKPKKWASNSQKTMACKLRKQGMTDEQIMAYFVKEGYTTIVKDTKSNSKSDTNHSKSTNDDLPETDVDTPEKMQQYAQKLILQGDMDRGNSIIKYLKDTGSLQTAGGSLTHIINLDPDHNLLSQLINPITGTVCKQHNMYCLAVSKKNIVGVGIRGTAKTETLSEALAKLVLTNQSYKAHLFSGQMPNVRALLDSIREWMRQHNIPDSLFETDNHEVIELTNKSFIRVHANDAESIRGTRGNLLWFDEAQFLSKDAFKEAIGLCSGVEDFTIWFTGNCGKAVGSAFETLCRNPDRVALFKELKMEYFEFTQDDIYWTSTESKSMVRSFLKAVDGQQALDEQVNFGWTSPEGNMYQADWIDAAFKPCSYPIYFDKIYAGVDWGQVHHTAISVWGVYQKQVYLLHIWAKTHPTGVDVKSQIMYVIDKFGAEIVWETSASGDFVRKDLRSDYPNLSFYDSNFANQKEKFLFIMYKLMGYNRMHCVDIDWLKDKDYTGMLAEVQALKNEFSHYNGDKKGDDRHDSSAHAIFKLNHEYNLVEFINKPAGAAQNV